MFESIPTSEKIMMCDQQIVAVESLIYSLMLNLGVDPSSVDPATIAVDVDANEATQNSQSEIIAALARRSFIEGVKTSLS